MKSMGWIRCALVIASWSAAACSQTENCVVTCAQDADCPGGQSCTLAGRCSSEDTCPCEPGAFLSCVEPGTAAFCADTGDTTRTEACGAPGCNAEAGRCNECVPGERTCDAETAVSSCGADGLPASMETCALPCVDDPAGARCGHIVPVWLPDVCDTDATTETVSFPAGVTVDTTLDTNCPEIIAQAEGPELCVYHANEITFDRAITFIGKRAIVFVADRDLVIAGLGNLIANASGSVSGPGGGRDVSGGPPDMGLGGGGAGFWMNGSASRGGAGGSPTTPAGAQNGGMSVDPATRAFFAGGPRAATSVPPNLTFSRVNGGGGGGGVLLISCRGTVTVSGTIAAGGGGGNGGRDIASTTETVLVGGGGGGAGGYVVLQGVDVAVTGSAYANGGAGGGGCGSDGCIGDPGHDAQPSLTIAAGGTGAGTGGSGGNGAGKSSSGGNGGKGVSPGGGGGSTGVFQVYTPAGRAPTIAPGIASPAFEAPRTVETR